MSLKVCKYKKFEEIKKLFNNKKLDKYNFDELYTSINDGDIITILDSIYNVIQRGRISYESNENLLETNNKNYKLSFFDSYLNFIIIILDTHPNKENIKKKFIKKDFLEIITTSINGHKYLNILKSFIISNLKDYKSTTMLYFAANKGTLLTFLFWRDIFKVDLLDQIYISTIIFSIENSDDRIFKWYINEINEKDKNIFIKNESIIRKLIITILKSVIPDKYKLKRIKLLSENCNLIPYFNDMIIHQNSNLVIYQLMKYYYKVPLEIENIINWVNCGNFKNNFKYKEIFEMLKTPKEKMLLNVFNILYNYDSLIDMEPYKLNYESIKEYSGIIFKVFNSKQILENFPNCYIELINKLGKINFFHNLTYNYFFEQNQIVFPYPKAQILTKFYSVEQKIMDNVFFNNFIAINKVLSFLRIQAKKIKRKKLIIFQSKYYSIHEELLNFKPKNIPILKNGSRNWQNQKQRFTHLPPRNLLPFEISIYNNFLLSEKADGILVNNLPLNVFPKIEDIFIRQVKAEYIEDLELYLVFDIDLPDMNILTRNEYLRSIHPFTNKFQKSKTINNVNTLINEITEERKLFNSFIKENKIKWYPKKSYLVENATDSFKQEIIMGMIENENSVLAKFINQEGPFNCDGLILYPLIGNCNREIKIKPKSLMTIDLLYDGNNWLDKEKNVNNAKISLNDIVLKSNKIYRCYPLKNYYTFTPREIRFDKKHPNSFDIINQILTIYRFDWTKEIKLENPYYKLIKPKLSPFYIKELIEQENILQEQITNMNPENAKTWLDLGCGKGKLIKYIKKYNPKKYVGLDVDVSILLNNIYIMDENDWINFNPCNLKEDWFENNKWYSIENMKFDYIVMNFSIMHFFDSEKFWKQLNLVCKPTTKILFNIVSNNIIKEPYQNKEAYMKKENNKVIYYFPWAQKHEISENFIKREEVENKMLTYNFLIDNIYNSKSDSLTSKYDWFTIIKN